MPTTLPASITEKIETNLVRKSWASVNPLPSLHDVLSAPLLVRRLSSLLVQGRPQRRFLEAALRLQTPKQISTLLARGPHTISWSVTQATNKPKKSLSPKEKQGGFLMSSQ